MGITVNALKAFRAKGFKTDSRINKKDRRLPAQLKHAVFSGYIKAIDDFAETITRFVDRGCIVQDKAMKGYILFSYPDTDKQAFDQFRNDLYETGNHLRFIGYSDRLVMGGF